MSVKFDGAYRVKGVEVPSRGSHWVGVDELTGEVAVESRSADGRIHRDSDSGYAACMLALKELLRVGDTRTSSPEFWMVYREGGRSPAFKHTTEASAVAEAKRVSRESDDTTYVLAVVSKVEPHAMPTVDEFARHAEMHGQGAIGFWRVTCRTEWPRIVAVRVLNGEAWHVSVADRVNLCRIDRDPAAKWFPVNENGKDVVEEDIPF